MTCFLITGGAGFIGSNLASRLLGKGHEVIIYDNFTRPMVERNITWLKSQQRFINKLQIIKGDVRDFKKLKKYVHKAGVVFHLAAQVAVTTSIINPVEDMEINILGTLNVLEAARSAKKIPLVVYASTNKVYGELAGVRIGNGITEDQPLDFHSPYGCSKGAADQYVRDYHRIYGIPTVVFRQSCVYGPRQYGVEDQGWLAYFAICALKKKTLTIYGDGRQIRDLLYIDDLVDAYLRAVININQCKGEIFNIGGGRKNSLSLIKSIEMLENRLNTKITLKYDKVRPGDQKVFISDNTKLKQLLGFEIKTGYSEGLGKLLTWLQKEVVPGK